MSWGASRNLTKDEITARPIFTSLVCLTSSSDTSKMIGLYCIIDFVEIANARHSWIKLRSALAYCNIALRLLFEEVYYPRKS